MKRIILNELTMASGLMIGQMFDVMCSIHYIDYILGL